MNVLPFAAGPSDGDIHDQIAAALEGPGYFVCNGVLDPAMLEGLFLHTRQLDEQQLQRAGIGRDQDHQLNRFVRTDRIRWLERGQSGPVDAYLAWTEGLRLALNRRLFLGLFDYEAHFARFNEGDYYKRHLDAFRGNTNRVLTTVLYLNPGWTTADGGELLMYAAEDSEEVIERLMPSFGTLVIFLSERFPHEVLPAGRQRHSIAGWFRVNNSLGEVIDPPK